jgi:hypothetical protein
MTTSQTVFVGNCKGGVPSCMGPSQRSAAAAVLLQVHYGVLDELNRESDFSAVCNTEGVEGGVGECKGIP